MILFSKCKKIHGSYSHWKKSFILKYSAECIKTKIRLLAKAFSGNKSLGNIFYGNKLPINYFWRTK